MESWTGAQGAFVVRAFYKNDDSFVIAVRSQNCHRFCKRLSQQKHIVFPSTTPLQLKRFKVGSKMAVATSVPSVAETEKNSVAKSPDSLTHPVHAFSLISHSSNPFCSTKYKN